MTDVLNPDLYGWDYGFTRESFYADRGEYTISVGRDLVHPEINVSFLLNGSYEMIGSTVDEADWTPEVHKRVAAFIRQHRLYVLGKKRENAEMHLRDAEEFIRRAERIKATLPTLSLTLDVVTKEEQHIRKS
jgi:hypothetical protein